MAFDEWFWISFEFIGFEFVPFLVKNRFARNRERDGDCENERKKTSEQL